MSTFKSCLLIVIALACYPVAAQKTTPAKAPHSSADALVSDLYRRHARKRGPFDQTGNRVLLRQYFAKDLADLIWKDRVTAKGEVGAIDGDPLYNAQDMEIKHLWVHPAVYAKGGAAVTVTFENFDQKQTIEVRLVYVGNSWKITNIKYQDRTDLRGILKAGT